MKDNSPIRLVDIWNKGPDFYRYEQAIKEINRILDEASKGILDSYSALCMIDSLLVYYSVSTHRTLIKNGEDHLFGSTRDLSSSRDCKGCRLIMPADIKTDRKELLCYNGDKWIKIPISRPPESAEK